MPKHLPTTKPAETKPDRRDRRVASARAAQVTVVERDHAVSASPAGQEALTRFVGLLARQQAQEDFSSQGDGA
jgi:hypothetical protein